jgi:cell wall-associated NlpC family hydrolase
VKKRYAFIAAAFAAVVFASMAPATAYADPTKEEIQKELDEKSDDLEKIIEKYNGAKEDLEKTEDRIEEIQDALPKLEDDAAEAREVVGNIAVAAYQGGDKVSRANTIMSGSPETALKRMSLMGAIDASQAADVANFSENVSDLENESKELKELTEDQKDIKSDLKEKKDKIEGEIADLETQQNAIGNPGGGWSGDLPPTPSGSAGDAVAFAYDQIGEPYSWGAAGPDSWDCSGLTMGAWSAAGIGLSHQTNAQWDETARVSREDLAPGDLVFYNGLAHVALYVGEGTIVHAPQAGQNVTAADIDSMGIDGYGRPY